MLYEQGKLVKLHFKAYMWYYSDMNAVMDESVKFEIRTCAKSVISQVSVC